MLAREEEYKLQLVQLEKDLLQSLATTEGNLLENTALIESLSLTKGTCGVVEYRCIVDRKLVVRHILRGVKNIQLYAGISNG